jgi:Lon-like protease
MDRTDWRLVHRLLAAAALLLLACVVANLIPLNEYVLTSGRPQLASSLITSGAAGRGGGKIVLSDVYATRVSVFGYLYYRFFGHTHVLSGATVLGPGIPPSELRLEEDAEAAQSVASAKAAALRSLGYTVGIRDVGVLVLGVEPGSPVSRDIRQGEIVTAVDGVASHSDCAFARALAHKRPGQLATLTVEESRVSAKGTVTGGPMVTDRVRLGRWPPSVPGSSAIPGCTGRLWTRRTGYLGLIGDTDESFRFPLSVSVSARALRGSSPGLAIALGIVDALSGGDLTGRRTVAAAGTITPNGHVGPVPSVPQTVFAAWSAGATLMFVPEGQVKAARLNAPLTLRVVGVRSLGQAIADLRALRGKVRAPSASR